MVSLKLFTKHKKFPQLEFLGIPLDPTSAELLCKIEREGVNHRLDNDLESEIKQLAKELRLVFIHGAENASPDLWKAYKLDKLIKGPNNHHHQQPPSNPAFTTEQFYFWSSYLHQLRLLGLRLNRFVMSALGFPRYLPSWWVIGSTFYLGEFFFDLLVVLYTTFKPLTPHRHANPLSYWSRFKNVLTKDERPTRIANSIIWSIVNIAFFYVSECINAVLNIIGFGLDVVVDGYKWWHETKKRQKLIDLLTEGLKQHPSPSPSRDTLNHAILQATKHYHAVNRDRSRLFAKSIVIFASMWLVFFYTHQPVLAALGAAGALLYGSVLYGFFVRFRETVQKLIDVYTGKPGYQPFLTSATPSIFECLAHHSYTPPLQSESPFRRSSSSSSSSSSHLPRAHSIHAFSKSSSFDHVSHLFSHSKSPISVPKEDTSDSRNATSPRRKT